MFACKKGGNNNNRLAGLDIAIEALRDCLTQRKCTVDELWKYSKICRVTNIFKPYIEAMI